MIPMIDLKTNYKSIKEELLIEIEEVLESSQFILGKKVSLFEQKLKDFLSVNNALTLASGTDALHFAIKTLGIKEGDEVITTPFTFFATAESVIYVGAKPVFVDIDGDTFNINTDLIEDKITDKTKAIIVVHLFGNPSEMDKIMDIAKRHNLKVIEDCAQSFGASYKGIKTGTFGDAGCFSFYPSKNLGAYGDGGLIVFRDSLIYDELKRLRNHGSLGGYIHESIGYNSRLDEIQAAVLLVKLKYIIKYNENRRACAFLYNGQLSNLDSIKVPYYSPDAYHVFHQYTIKSPKRDYIQKILKENEISSVVYYPIPLHLQKALTYLGYKEGDFPMAESVSKEVLSLPIYPELKSDDIIKICKVISQAL